MSRVLEKLRKFRTWALSRPWVLMALLLPFFKPEALVKQVPVMAWAFVGWKGVSVACIGLAWLSRPKMSKATALLIAYTLLELASTWASGRDVYSMVFLAGNVVALGLCIEICVEEDPRALLRGLVWLLGALCLINLATVLLFPSGIYAAHYFLGYDNSHSLFIIPLLGFGMAYACHAGWRLWQKLALLAVFSASVYVTWSASAVVAVTVFLALALAYELGLRLRVCNVCVYYAVLLALFLGVVVFRVQNIFAYIIRDVLGKDLTFTGRTAIWDASIALIRQRPLLGYGNIAFAEMTELVGNVNCHNLILQVLVEAGAVGLAVYAAMLGLLVKPLMRTREHYLGYYLSAALGALLLVFTVESPVYPLPYYAVCLLAYHAPALAEKLDGRA